LVHPEDECTVGQLTLHDGQPLFTEVAVTSVVVPTLGVVVVGYHGGPQAGGGEEVQSLEPVRIFTYFVDLVHGNGRDAERQGCGAGEGHRSTEGELVRQQLRDDR